MLHLVFRKDLPKLYIMAMLDSTICIYYSISIFLVVHTWLTYWHFRQ